MADSKITALPALTTPAATDLAAVVDLSGAPTTKKSTLGQVWNALLAALGVPAANVALPKTGTVAGGSSLARDFSIGGSSGIIDPTVVYVTSGGAGLVNVAAGEGYFRTSASPLAPLVFGAWLASNGNVIPAPAAGQETTRWVVVEYNGGSPRVSIRTTANWSGYDDFPLGRVAYESDGEMTVLNTYAHAEDTAHLARQWLRKMFPFQREVPPEGSGGLVIGETGTRNLTMTAGTIWHGFNKYALVAVNTSGTDRAEIHYRRAGGGFESVTGLTQWPNAQYDDGSGTLATLSGANKYAVLWVYVDVAENALHMMYGRAEYNTAAAAAAEPTPATTPDHMSYEARLLGHIVFKNGAATAALITSVWSSQFTPTGITDHSQLANLDFSAAGHTGLLPLANGGVHADLSATGGASQVLRQSSAGANVTVSRLASSDLSDGPFQAPTEFTTTATGNIDDLDFSNAALVRMNNASLSTIRGLKAGVAGQQVTFISLGAGQVDFSHQNTGDGTAANRLINAVSSIPTSLSPGTGKATYQYDGTTARWRLVSHEQGLGITIASPTLAANLGGTFSGTAVTYAYKLVGVYVFVIIDFQGCTITGAPTILFISHPYSCPAKTKNLCRVLDNGVAVEGFFNARDDDPTNIWISRQDSAAFTAAAGTTALQGQIQFQIT